MGRIKTGLLMMNMGGPATLDQVNPFLRRLFTDSEIIDLGRFQSFLVSILSDSFDSVLIIIRVHSSPIEGLQRFKRNMHE